MKSTVKTCPTCGKTFTTKYDQIACSRECIQRKDTRPKRLCPTCGKWFDNKHPDQIHCSRACVPAGRAKPRICPQCNKEFYDPKHADKEYCSMECFLESRYETVQCSCGNWFRRSKKRHPAKSCSVECKYKYMRRKPGDPNSRETRICEHCEKPFTCWSYRSSRYCSRECHGASQRVPGSVQYRGENWNSQRRKALKRDGYKCQICGRKRKLGQKYVISVHHIKPYRMFDGDYESANQLSNLITLCNKCHRRAERGKIACPQPLL